VDVKDDDAAGCGGFPAVDVGEDRALAVGDGAQQRVEFVQVEEVNVGIAASQ